MKISRRGDPSKDNADVSLDAYQERRKKIANFFRAHRLQAHLSLETVAQDLGLEDSSILLAYEAAVDPIPLDIIFALTNVLNIAPEDTMNVIFDTHRDQGRI